MNLHTVNNSPLTDLRRWLGRLAVLAMMTTAAAAGASPAAEPVSPPTEAAAAKTPPADTVDLNTATVEQLCTLPGIGKKKAEAIIAQRERHPYRRITQLLRVKGIGPRTVRRLKPLLRVGPPPKNQDPATTPATTPVP